MIEELLPLKLPPGLYRNGTRYQTKGRWYDGNLVRFYEGTVRPVQGWRVASDNNGEPIPQLLGIPRAALGWRSATGAPLLAIGTTEALYVIKDGVTYDITPVDFTAGAGSSGSGGNGDYGFGLYGAGLYGVGRASLAASLNDADTWQLDAFGDVLIAVCTNGGRIYTWTGNTSAVAEVATNSPEPNRGAVITPERFVVALGASDDVRLVAWAAQATLTTWTPAVDNTAGDFTLSTNGRIMCGRRTKSQTLIWTDADLHSMNYVGGDVIYSFKQEGDNCGIIAPQAAAVVDTAALWMGQDSFFIYDGFVKPLDCEVHDHVFGSFNKQQAAKVFACPISEFGEIWWFYPSGSSEENDSYVVYNYRENHWTTGKLARTAAIDRGALPSPVMFDGNGVIYQHEQPGGGRTVPLATILRDTELDSNGVLLQAHTPAPGVFSWLQIAGDSVKFAENFLVRETVAQISAPFTAADGTALTAYTLPTGGTFEGTDAVNFTVQGNVAQRVQNVSTIASTTARVTLAVGAEVYCDMAYPASMNATQGPAFSFLDNALLAGALEQYFLVLHAVDGTHVTVNMRELAGGADQLVSNATHTEGAAMRYGIKVMSGTTFQVWQEPAGGGTRTVLGTWTSSSNHLDASHQRVGIACFGGGGPFITYTWDNLTVQAPPVRATYVANVDPGQSDYDVSAFVTKDASVGARMKNTDARGYFFGLDSTGANFRLFGRNAAEVDLFTEKTLPVPAGLLGTNMFLTIRVLGSSITGYANNLEMLSVTDAILPDGLAGQQFEADAKASGDFSVKGNTVPDSSNPTIGETTPDPVTGEAILLPFLESGPIELGDGDRVFRVQRIVPDEKNLGDVRMRFFTARFPTDTETERGPYTLTAPTSVRFTARQVRMRVEEVNETDWRVGTVRLGVIPGGRR